MKIYHNPRCGKSREALQLLKEKGVTPEVVLYLKDVPTEAELKELIAKLGISPIELVRKNEAIYKEKFKNKEYSDGEWIKIMIEYPKLIERPIIVQKDKAVIGRPATNILELL